MCVCLTLCDPMDCSPSASSVHGILQARILEWVAMPSSMGSSPPRDQTHVSYVSSTGRLISKLLCLPDGLEGLNYYNEYNFENVSFGIKLKS